MAKQTRKGLGRGLSALMADVEPVAEPSVQSGAPREPRTVSLDRISPNPDQPRRSFDDAAMADLTRSVREKGVIQPLILRTHPQDAQRFEIVAGERRWRAAQAAQLHDVPAIIREFNDTEVLEIAIIENIQRADLNPLDEARGYKQLMDRFGHTQEKVSEALGKSRSHIANLIRLLALPETIQRLLEAGDLSAGHARALLTADHPEELAQRIIAQGLSVRETERLAKTAPKPTKPAKKEELKDADTRRLEADLSAAIGMKVGIDHAGETGGGRISIKYKSLDDLDEICRRLSLSQVSA